MFLKFENGIEYKKRLSSRWYVLLLVSLTMLFSNAQRMGLPVLFEEIKTDLGLSLVQIGAIWGMDPLGGVFVALFSGLVIDRFGVKRTVTIISFFMGIFGILRGLAADFMSLLTIMFLFGLLVASMPTLLPKVIAIWFKDHKLGLANGILTTAGSLGSMGATMLSAVFLSPVLGGWRHVLFFFSLPVFALSFLWLMTYRKPNEVGDQSITEKAIPFRQALSHVIRIKEVWIIGIIEMGSFSAMMGVIGYLPLYLRGMGWHPAAADSALTVLLGSIGACAIPISMLSDRLGSRKRVLVPLLITLAISVILIPLANGIWVWILVTLNGLMLGGMFPLFMALMVELKGIGSTYAGTAFGLAVSIYMLGSFISPPLGNSVAYFHPGLPFVLWGVVAGILLLGFIFIREN